MKSLLNKQNLSIAYAVVFRGLGVLATFGLNYLIGNMLGAAKAGVYFQAFSLFMIFSLISSFGMNNTVFIKSSELVSLNDIAGLKELLKKSAIIVFGITIIFIPLIFISDDIIKKFLSEEAKKLVQILILGLFPFIFVNILSESLKALKQVFWASFFQSFLGNTLVFIVAFVLFVKGESLKSFIVGFVIVYWIISLFAFAVLRYKIKSSGNFKFKKKVTYSGIINFSKHLFLISVLSTVIANIDVIILGRFVADEKIGIYGMALKVSLIISFILPALNTVFVPVIKDSFVKNDLKKLKETAVKSSKIMTLFTIPFVLIFIVFNVQIMSLFGEEFSKSGIILIIMVIGQFIRSINASSGFIAMSCGKHKQMTYNLILTFILHISLMFLVIPKFGIIGAAIVRTFSMSFQDTFSTVLSKQIIGSYPVFGLDYLKKTLK